VSWIKAASVCQVGLSGNTVYRIGKYTDSCMSIMERKYQLREIGKGGGGGRQNTQTAG
jgi:hypothetical protein